MEKRVAALESEISSLSHRVRILEARLAALETGPATALASPGRSPAAVAPAAVADEAVPAERVRDRADAIGTLSIVGRILIIIGGAFLLRALTEGAVLSPMVGVSLGLAYALVWSLVAAREAGKGRRWSANAHGLAAVIISYPAIWEAVTRFRFLSQPWDAVLLAALTAALLAVACRNSLQPLAWMATLASVGTAAGLLVSTGVAVPFSVFLTALGIATLWIGYELEWRGLRWPVAVAANLAVAAITFRALAPQPRDTVASAMTVQLLLLSLYLGTVVVRTLVRARNVIPFEVIQVAASFVVGFAGAVYTMRATGYGAGMLGAAGLLLGVACYAAAFAFVGRRQGRGRNFYFYASMALVFTLTGSALLLSGRTLGLAWAIFGLLSGWLGYRFSRLALTIQAAVGLVASALVSGLFVHASSAFTGSGAPVPSLPLWEALVVIAAAAFCATLPLPSQPEGGAVWTRIPRLAITLVFLGGIGGLVVSAAATVLGAYSAAGFAAGSVATIRTIVLSLAAIVLAWGGRHERVAEWGWLVYPVLGLTGLKVLLQDLPHSKPATLFLALAVFGAALILSPRLKTRKQ